MAKTWSKKFYHGDRVVEVFSYDSNEVDVNNDTVGIFVDYDNRLFAGTLITPLWISEYLSKNDMGDIGWYSDCNLVLPDLSKQTIVAGIQNLIERKTLNSVFRLCDANNYD